MMPRRIEPRILAFLCTWCSYRAADEIGRSRQDYPPAIRIVRVPCSGRVDPQWMLAALEQGADGVILIGCPPGNCHYRNGNVHALKRIILLERLLRDLGINSARVRLDWAAPGDEGKLLAVFGEMVNVIEKMAPLVPLEPRGSSEGFSRNFPTRKDSSS